MRVNGERLWQRLMAMAEIVRATVDVTIDQFTTIYVMNVRAFTIADDQIDSRHAKGLDFAWTHVLGGHGEDRIFSFTQWTFPSLLQVPWYVWG